ncbi:MAG: flagellar hook-associated protein FlgK [Rhodopseudomonas sp.]|nr:flagellar hook-associated protein FlgK [Rhodopseudomonas sp.]
MSLSVARYAAYSAMMTTQLQISVASSNIANADTAGYTKKSAAQTSTVSNGVGTGTTVTAVTSNVDKLMLKSLMSAVSALGTATTNDSYASQLQSLFGSTSSSSDSSAGTSLGNTLASLETALSQLADTPESTTLKAQVVSDLDDVAAQLRDTSSQIQTLRSNADQEISSDVDSVNSSLATIKDLNDQITAAAASGNPTADLEDKRNQALQDLSSLMDVSYFTNTSGQMQIYTTSGQVLLDSSVHKLSYQTASSVSASTSYSASSSAGLSGIMVDGTDITSQIKSGSIAGLVEQRDVTLPAAQDELDQLAVQLAATLNGISNSGTSDPPPSSLTGTTAVAATDSFSGTGTVRIAVTDSDSNLVSYQDLDLSSYSTVGDLVDAINSISGLSASIDSNGHVAISADSSSNGVAINEMTSSVGSSGQGLSDYLGLNDLVSATGASDFKVRSDILSNSSLLPSSTLGSSASLTVGAQVVTEGSMTVAQNLYDALSGNQSFDAAGGLSSRKTSFASYAADIVAGVAADATRASNTLTTKQAVETSLSDSISSASGVNIDEETATLTQLQNEYAAAAQVMQILNSMFSSLLDSVQSS